MTDLELLKAQVAELMEWKRERTLQQLRYPVDEVSKSALGAAVYVGVGSTTKTQAYVDSRGDSVTAPKAYAQTVLLLANGTQYEFPSLI